MGKVAKVSTYAAVIILIGVMVSELCFDGTTHLGGGYNLTDNKPQIIYGPAITIPPEIVDYKFDNRYIIVMQRLEGRFPQREFYDTYKYDYPSCFGDYYWIIDKQANLFYGPIVKDDFNKKLDSLSIKISLGNE